MFPYAVSISCISALPALLVYMCVGTRSFKPFRFIVMY